MINIGLFEDEGWRSLLPLTWLRATFELRCGVNRLMDKTAWLGEGQVTALWPRRALSKVLATRLRPPEALGDAWCIVNGRAFFTRKVKLPGPGVAWALDGELVASGLAGEDIAGFDPADVQNADGQAAWLESCKVEEPPDGVTLVRYPWELTLRNADELRNQCTRCGILEGEIYGGAHLLNESQIIVDRGAKVKSGVVLDAESGPVVIRRGAVIEPNAVLIGPCFVDQDAIVRAGAHLRGGVSVGPVCKIGGEVDATIFHGYSNKQHDGFVGHSYIGEWVNLGADTITSDLKNTYGAIRVFLNGQGVETGERFLGAVIGDHAKTGIGTILPTGCIVGAAANVFTQHATPKFVPSFAWLTENGLDTYDVSKAITIARIVMSRRNVDLTPDEADLLAAVAREAPQIEAAGWSRLGK